MANFTGTAGADSLLGTSSSDHLDGLDGNDTLDGAGGDDYLNGGAGNDSLVGGPGHDQLNYYASPAPVLVNLATGTATGWGNDTLSGIEAVSGTAFQDTLIGGDDDDSFYGFEGNDSIDGGGGADYLDAGEGNDHVSGGDGDDLLIGREGNDTLDGGNEGPFGDYAAYYNATSGVVVDLAAGTASDGDGGTDVLIGIENVHGSDGNDSIRGDGNYNVLYGWDGNDTIEGGAGGDSLDGGDGGDSLDGGTGIDTLYGGAGDDTLDAEPGSLDRLSYVWDPAGVTVDLEERTATDGFGGTDTLGTFVYVTGSEYDDFIVGTSDRDTLDGGGGDDTISAGIGAVLDQLYGGGGHDTALFAYVFSAYQVSFLSDLVWVVSGPEGAVMLYDFESLQFGTTPVQVSEGSDEGDELDGTEGDDIIRGLGGNDLVRGGAGDDGLFGDEGDDELEGGTGDDQLDGGSGNDTMEGGEGNDVYYVDAEGDRVVEPDSIVQSLPGGSHGQVSIGSGIERVVATINYTVGNAVENLDLAGSALQGTGNALSNVLNGNALANVLRGLGGNDTIDGGAGLDTAAYAGNRAQYVATATSVDGTAAGEGIDSIANIERLDFADVDLALDLDGHAGEVARILGAVFGAASVSNEVYAGIGLRLADQGMSYEALMELALGAMLGGAPSNAQVVTLLYTNVIGSAPDAGTRDYYAGWIEQGQFTQVTLAVLAANYMGLPAAAAGGLEYV